MVSGINRQGKMLTTSVKGIIKGVMVVSLSSLMGCQSIGPNVLNRDRYHYNLAMNYSSNQELLLNMVRLRYDESTVVLKVGTISSNPHIGTGANLQSTLSFPNPGKTTGTATPGASVDYSDSPTMSYSPLDGPEFTQSFLRPLSLEDLGLLMQDAWSIPRIMRIGLQRVGNVYNASSSTRPTSSHVPEYQNFIDMTYVLRRMQLEDSITGFYAKSGDIEELTLEIKPGYRLTSQEKAILDKAGVEIYHHKIIFTNTPAPHKVFIITRSLIGVLNYLSKGVIVPQADADRKIITQTVYDDGTVFDWQKVVRGMMKIYHSEIKPNDAYISIYYRNRWYYIKDSDSDSKQTLILLSNMAGLIENTSSVDKTPLLLTRSIGR
jgi:hypothetical protein